MPERKFVARGLTAIDRGKRLEYSHPMMGVPQFGEIETVTYDPMTSQTLVTLKVRVALDDMQEVIVYG